MTDDKFAPDCRDDCEKHLTCCGPKTKLNPGDIVMWYPQGEDVRPYVCSVARVMTVDLGLKPLVDDTTREHYLRLSDEEYEELKQAEWYEAGNPNIDPEDMNFDHEDMGRRGHYGLIFCWYLMNKVRPANSPFVDDCQPKILWRMPQQVER